MSSRQVRKLQQQRELEAFAAKLSSGESEDDKPVVRAKPSTFAGFAALGGGNNDDEDDDDDDGDDDEGNNDVNEGTRKPPGSELKGTAEGEKAGSVDDQTTANKSTTSKKSKKKKKKAKKSNPPEMLAKKSAAERDDKVNNDDEIDRALRELNLANKDSASAQHGSGKSAEMRAYERICELLQVNTHHLKVMNEMRRMFGSDAIEAVRREEQQEEAAAARQLGRRRTQHVGLEGILKGARGQSLPEVTLKRNPFLDGKESWPKAGVDGLTMEQVPDSELCRNSETMEFRFAHDAAYNAKEMAFFSLAQMFDGMQLVNFLVENPYHVSTLIQVTKVAKQDQNLALATDLCERALFTFGRVSISLFRKKLQEGKARLDFMRPENRQFWLAGYHYVRYLMQKGSFRTALEWVKVLYSMDPSDPYGLVHFLHVFAIRCGESAWFIDFCDSEALDECETAQDYIRQTLVLARLQRDDKAGARTLLVEGMERLPWLYSSLFKGLGLDVPKVIWGFTARDAHDELYTELYVNQTKKLWDNSQATGLLKEAAALATKPDESNFAPLSVVGRNLARFIYLLDIPELMGLVPNRMLASQPNWESDPLPPLLTENIFSHESQKQPWQPTIGGPGAVMDRMDENQARQLMRLVRRMQRAGGAGNNRELQRMAQELQAAQDGGALPDDWLEDSDEADLDDDDVGDDIDGEAGEGMPGSAAAQQAPGYYTGLLRNALAMFGVRGTEVDGETQQLGEHETDAAGETDPQTMEQPPTDHGRIPGAYVEDYDDSEDDVPGPNVGRR
ncbi:transcription factor 25 [Microdochium nivale]|nr:transcription factor 25 [Microdochium nivale]